MELSALFCAAKYPSMTSYFALVFLAGFLPLCLLIYSLTPTRFKKYVLLLSGFTFFWLISGKLIVYLLLTVLLIHYFGLWIDRILTKRNTELKSAQKSDKKRIRRDYLIKCRLVLGFAAVLLIGTLLTLKYSPFFAKNINSVFAAFHSPFRLAIPKYLMPIGISFYTLQAMSYLFDVYREKISVDDNIFRLALFMSFFPQIVEGPICRYEQTADQLWNVGGIKYENLVLGAERILYGLMKKIVVADRLNPLISEVFTNYENYGGALISVAAVCYTVQLYMDFSGTMDAVMGIGQMFGVVMPENFERPFFSKTISEFWKRWHITLGTWFRDYVFYPVTMSKPMKKLTSASRKRLGNHYGPLTAGSVALFCVWFCNGLWHGAAWNYIFFGMYHFSLILIGNIITPAVRTVNERLHINSESAVYRLLQMLRTCVLVVIGEMFFRAHGLRAGLIMFKKIFTDFGAVGAVDTAFTAKLGVDVLDMLVVAVTLCFVFAVSVINEKGVCLRGSIAKRNIAVRWGLLYAMILFIVVFGAYGPGYVPVDPIYANF